MKQVIVPASKVKACKKCGGKWAWAQSKAGKWYPANAEWFGEVNGSNSYLVNVLSHFRFCVKAIETKNSNVDFYEKKIAWYENYVEQEVAANSPQFWIDQCVEEMNAWKQKRDVELGTYVASAPN
jgi:hypothetical protein